VVTDEYGIERQLGLEPLVDGLHHRATLDPLGNVGLVSDDHEEKAGCFQVCQSIRDPGQNLESGNGIGRVRFTLADDGAVEDTVAVEEDCPAATGT
jgi:hypothetical protein